MDRAVFNSFVKAAKEEFAPGIPKDRRIEPLPTVAKPKEWTLAVQRHKAERAGEHLDLRLVDPETGHAHSWAIPKAHLPSPGDKAVLAVPQPTHTAEYALTGGDKKPLKIKSGYGKGVVALERKETAEVYHSDPHKPTALRFNLYTERGPEEFAIVRTQSGKQLLVNKTKTKERLTHVPLGDKPKVKLRKPEQVDFDDTNEVMMPKYDGAHTLLDLARAGKIGRIFSYRTPKGGKAGVIEHTHKVPRLLEQPVPKDLKGTVLRTELIGVDREGRAVPAHDIGGMLNAKVPRSRELQKQKEVSLVPVGLDVVRFRGKDVTKLPFDDRYAMLQEVGKEMGILVAEAATSPEDKKQLLDAIRRGVHPMTNEGVILRSRSVPEKLMKVKFRPDHDVYVREVFGAVGKAGKLDRAGGFAYSHTPRGRVVGRVGTGLDHETARDMLQHPDKYVGRVAKVEAEKKMRSGALSKPSFIEWHLDKGKQL